MLSLPSRSLFFFLSLFLAYFAGMTSLSPYSGANAVLSVALNHAVAI